MSVCSTKSSFSPFWRTLTHLSADIFSSSTVNSDISGVIIICEKGVFCYHRLNESSLYYSVRYWIEDFRRVRSRCLSVLIYHKLLISLIFNNSGFYNSDFTQIWYLFYKIGGARVVIWNPHFNNSGFYNYILSHFFLNIISIIFLFL